VIEHLTNRLEILCDWRDQLDVQLRRAELLNELGLLDDDMREQLEHRVCLWCDAADTLAGSLDGRRGAA
jgi:hypothetical protein